MSSHISQGLLRATKKGVPVATDCPGVANFKIS
jgi:hypothetical protein